MPKAYVVFTETIRDAAGMEAYGAKAIPTIMQAATILAADENPTVLEGDWPGQRTVVLEFESADAARAWYDSSEYQAAIPLRRAAAEANVVIITGL